VILTPLATIGVCTRLGINEVAVGEGVRVAVSVGLILVAEGMGLGVRVGGLLVGLAAVAASVGTIGSSRQANRKTKRMRNTWTRRRGNFLNIRKYDRQSWPELYPAILICLASIGPTAVEIWFSRDRSFSIRKF
jgi:hypothetical protein